MYSRLSTQSSSPLFGLFSTTNRSGPLSFDLSRRFIPPRLKCPEPLTNHYLPYPLTPYLVLIKDVKVVPRTYSIPTTKLNVTTTLLIHGGDSSGNTLLIIGKLNRYDEMLQHKRTRYFVWSLNIEECVTLLAKTIRRRGVRATCEV